MSHAAFVFDAYGTLFDVHAAVRKYSSKVGPDAQLLSEIWRAKQLEYSWVRALMGNYVDFWQLTEQALDFAFSKVTSADAQHKSEILEAYWKLDCYPEVPAILKALKNQGAKLAILSNGSPEMLVSAVENSKLGDLFDDVLSVDTLKTFKTTQSVYEMVTNQYRLYPDAVSYQSSNRWDIAGAAKFGFDTVWINRTNMPDEYRDFSPKTILPDLKGLIQE